MSEAPAHPDSSSAFSLLAEGVQRQLYRMKWTALRSIQATAIRAYLQTDADLLISAETAGGKTEAAFLPVLSSISAEPTGSVRALYVGPLKALINDQFQRLEELCTYLDVPVHRWHGDVPASRKDALIRSPSGVLLITPESIESLLINRTSHLVALLGGLRTVVVDEVHVFLEGERGVHLASLLSRLRRYQTGSGRLLRMIGLSATISDISAAQRYLAPDHADSVVVISDREGKEIRFRIQGYSTGAPSSDADGGVSDQSDPNERAMAALATDLVEHCRGNSNLVFANAKGTIELLADMANETCRREGLPETFLVHHGSLAKEVREDAETLMKNGRSLTTICSSTLELGIDIGSVFMVGQVGAPWSVASFKQRLGRSGRKDGEPRRLRGYVICEEHQQPTYPVAQLPLELLQIIAVCDLMLEKWLEPPAPATLDLSTLTHQIVSTIAETGAIDAMALYQRLCRAGPFRGFSTVLFTRVLRELGAADVIEQGPDNRLILGLEGEKLRHRKDFYAAFASREEFSIIAGDRKLGTLPISTVPKPGEHILFAARRWQVTQVDETKFVLYVQPANRRQPPKFLGSLGEIHARIRERMMTILASTDLPSYLDPAALKILAQARQVARTHDLARRRVIDLGEERSMVLTWTGTAAQRTLLALLGATGIETTDHEVAIECRASHVALATQLTRSQSLLERPLALARHISCKRFRKYDHLFSDALLDQAIAADRLDVQSALTILAEVSASTATT